MKFTDLIHPTHLAACFGVVRQRSAAAGRDGVTPTAFAAELAPRLQALSRALAEGSYRPGPLLRLRIDKPGGGVRRLAIATVTDRVVIQALQGALAPRIEAQLGDAAYAYRPRRSARAAVERVQRSIRGGASHVALGDIRDFFDSLPLLVVIDALRGLRLDPDVLSLCQGLLQAQALRPGRGLAQGSALSPLLSNLALAAVDARLVRDGWSLIRYSDNLCLPGPSQAHAERALQAAQRELARLSLVLKPSASQVVAVAQGFQWLGFLIGAGGLQVSAGAVAALRARVEAAAAGDRAGLEARLTPIVRGWAQYFDAPLPAAAELGEHGELLRALLGAQARAPDSDGLDERAFAGLEDDDTAGAVAEGEDEERDEADDADEARGAAGGAVAALLLQADQQASVGAFARAEALYERAQRLASEPAAEGAVASPDPVWSEEVIDAFIGLFAAGQERFEVARQSPLPQRSAGSGRGAASPARGASFSPVERPIESGDVRAHLAGRGALAIRPRLPDGTCTLGVIDLDAPVGADAALALAAYTQALCGAARVLGVTLLVEHTGGRGVHLWAPLAGRLRAALMAALLQRLLAAAGTPAAGLKAEILPAPDDAPELHAQVIALPLSVHRQTGARSLLSVADGATLGGELRALLTIPGNAPQHLAALVDPGVASASARGEPDPPTARGEPPTARGEPVEPPPTATFTVEQDAARTVAAARAAARPDRDEFGGSVERVLAGCALLRHLEGKAQATGHLDHGERLSLLYSLGHLGPPGERAVHALIAPCRDYDPVETERQIKKMSGLPIGCARLRQKHATPELLPQCSCDFGVSLRRGGYATPLLHALGFKRDWKKELQRRREVDKELRDPAARASLGVRVEPVPEAEERGVTVACAPPHEWA